MSKTVKRWALRLDYSTTYVLAEDDMIRLSHLFYRAVRVELPQGHYTGTYHISEDQDKPILADLQLIDLEIEDEQEAQLPKPVIYAVDARTLP